jgi:transposase-like protein
MIWQERSRMDKRLVLVGEYLKGEKPMTELCLEFGVSRKTGHKWVGRYNEGGPGALEEVWSGGRRAAARPGLSVPDYLLIESAFTIVQ